MSTNKSLRVVGFYAIAAALAVMQTGCQQADSATESSQSSAQAARPPSPAAPQ